MMRQAVKAILAGDMEARKLQEEWKEAQKQ